MAFVSQSKRESVFESEIKGSNKDLGPGTYDIDHTVHKEVMAVLFPKKKVPFNIKENRDVVEAYIPPKHETPGKLTVQ